MQLVNWHRSGTTPRQPLVRRTAWVERHEQFTSWPWRLETPRKMNNGTRDETILVFISEYVPVLTCGQGMFQKVTDPNRAKRCAEDLDRRNGFNCSELEDFAC